MLVALDLCRRKGNRRPYFPATSPGPFSAIRHVCPERGPGGRGQGRAPAAPRGSRGSDPSPGPRTQPTHTDCPPRGEQWPGTIRVRRGEGPFHGLQRPRAGATHSAALPAGGGGGVSRIIGLTSLQPPPHCPGEGDGAPVGDREAPGRITPGTRPPGSEGGCPKADPGRGAPPRPPRPPEEPSPAQPFAAARGAGTGAGRS